MDTLFVYGTLKKGFPNHSYLKDSEMLGIDQVYGFRMADLGEYPGCYPGDGTVQVEIYRITESLLRELDILEEVPELFNRLKTVSEKGISGWIYQLSDKIRVQDYTEISDGYWNKK